MPAVSIPLAVQKAIFARLTAHFAAAGKAWPVYDDVPDNAAISCVQIGMVATQTDDILDAEYSVVVVPVIGWSTHRGQKEAHEINAEVRAALHEADVAIEAGAAYHVSIERQFVDSDLDGNDKPVYSGTSIVTFRVKH